MFDLNFSIYSLLHDEPFFAALSRSVDKRASNAIPTAGVCVDEDTGHFILYYNPEYFQKLSQTKRKGVLKHEFYHLIFEHVTSRLPAQGLTMLWNIATDLAINSYLPDQLPEGCCMPGEGKFAKFPPHKTAEWYFERLQEDEDFQNENDGNNPGEGQFDNHGGWGEVSNQTKEIAKERLKGMVKSAAEECADGKGWGSVSTSVRRDIIDRIVSSPLDWKRVLRYFVKTSQRADKVSTIKKINRRYPYVHAGRKTSRQAKIAISVDQSGSVSDGMLSAFFRELGELAKLAEFTVIPFDDQVFEDKVFVWKKGKSHARERVLCGGTNFDAPTKYANDHGFDGHIILTDMYAPKPIASKCQRMWMTDRNGGSMPYFKTNEKIIVIDA